VGKERFAAFRTLTEPQLLKLAAATKNLAASELNRVLDAFAEAKSDAVGRRLVGSLRASSAATSLNAFRLRGLLAAYGPVVQGDAEPLFKQLEAAQAEQLAKAERITALAASADPHRGLQVFHSNPAACTACHKAANVGGTIGPSLRGIAGRRTERDFVESILFPSATQVQSYESWNVVTDDGRTLSGVIERDTPDELVLTAGPDKTARIPKRAIEAMTRSETSIMPQGIDKTLTEQQLADLVAYLKSLK
jgi:putative heme-binding domain-containing protein